MHCTRKNVAGDRIFQLSSGGWKEIQHFFRFSTLLWHWHWCTYYTVPPPSLAARSFNGKISMRIMNIHTIRRWRRHTKHFRSVHKYRHHFHPNPPLSSQYEHKTECKEHFGTNLSRSHSVVVSRPVYCATTTAEDAPDKRIVVSPSACQTKDARDETDWVQ